MMRAIGVCSCREWRAAYRADKGSPVLSFYVRLLTGFVYWPGAATSIVMLFIPADDRVSNTFECPHIATFWFCSCG